VIIVKLNPQKQRKPKKLYLHEQKERRCTEDLKRNTEPGPSLCSEGGGGGRTLGFNNKNIPQKESYWEMHCFSYSKKFFLFEY
jgi:hypothetical protein